MKRLKLILLALLLVPLLCACCIRHDWQSADCVNPAFCLKCGKTQGAALGHDWQEASCLEPRLCTRCGVSEGEALGHDIEGGFCTCCGQAVEQRTAAPDFETLGISTRLALNEQLPFTTATRDDPAALTTGTAAVTGFGIIPPDAAHPEREGYEWLYVIIQAGFYDDNARAGGVTVMCDVEDYYNLQLRGSTEHADADGMTVYSVMIDGELLECRYRRQSQWSPWQYNADGRREIVYTSMWEIQQPVNYDGTVVGIYSSEIKWEYGQYINEVYDDSRFLLFRLG